MGDNYAATAAEQALKMQRRRELQAALQKIQSEITKVLSIKTILTAVNAGIATSLTQWGNQLSSFQASVMAPVVVTDKFEGESATKISTKLPEPINKMAEIGAAALVVQDDIAEQISKLEIYIEKLEVEKAALEAELASI